MNKKVFSSPPEDEDSLLPVIEIGQEAYNNGIEAVYYNDFSGEISITDDDGEVIFFKEDGRLKHHIEYLNEAIGDIEKKFKRDVKTFKKAIVLLKKEQAKYQAKMKKKKGKAK